jgi:hypothetical protein
VYVVHKRANIQRYVPYLVAVLPDGLDQLRLREVLFAVIITTVNIVGVCKSASSVGNNITD